MKGPYRFTRNPQYIGDMASLLGIALFVNSLLAMVLASVGICCFWLTLFTEEPWLRQRYGSEYEKYCGKVPSFFGLHKPPT